MKKTDNYFVISNYNTDPMHLFQYCKDYIIYDQSDNPEIKKKLIGLNVIESKHTGHNITDYFQFFIDNYDNLPEFMALIKGNIFHRHLSKEFFEKVYNNKYYTFLFEKSEYRSMYSDSWFLFSENEYLEYNNSWFVQQHPHLYSNNYNKLLKFIYKDPVFPRYNLFSPGACYIISKFQVLKNSKQFYKNLIKIISYTNPVNPFPSEAHQIERMLHIIYTSNYAVNDYMDSDIEFDKALIENKKKVSKTLLKYNADKSSDAHTTLLKEQSFGQLFVDILSHFKKKTKVNILEFGVHNWESLDAWEQCFSNVSVFGVGIKNLPTKEHKSARVKYVASPIKEINISENFKKTKFDIIVYEGYFFKEEGLYVLNNYAELVNVGGIIILADVHDRIVYWMASIINLKVIKRGCFQLKYPKIMNKKNIADNTDNDFLIFKKHKNSLTKRILCLVYNHTIVAFFILKTVRFKTVLLKLKRFYSGLFRGISEKYISN